MGTALLRILKYYEDHLALDLSVDHFHGLDSFVYPYNKPVIWIPDVNPEIKNVVSNVHLGCRLDLVKVAELAKNVEFKTKRCTSVVIRIREPCTTALIFASGKVICNGAKNEEEAYVAARKFARIIQKMGYPVKFLQFKIQNMVGTCDVRFPIRLFDLLHAQRQFSSYNPEHFPGLTYRMVKPRVVVQIFDSGKILFSGATSREEMDEAFQNIYPILLKFRDLNQLHN